MSQSKRDKIISLIDNYLWCTRGGVLEDDYSIKDEEDFSEFLEELDRLLSEP